MPKPMLAASLDKLENAKLPSYVSPKLDGIRCITFGGKAISRTLKPIPNKFIQKQLSTLPDGLDGELLIKVGTSVGTFTEIQSAVMSEEGEPDFIYVVFDVIASGKYLERYQVLHDTVDMYKHPRVKIISTTLVESLDELFALEGSYVSAGYEGIMLRDVDSLYKQGRSTLRQGWLVKFKRFQDDEAVVIGFEEKEHNDNPQSLNELGHKVRSSKQEGKTPVNTLGALLVRWKDKEFKVIGFKECRAKEIWDNKDKYLDKEVTFRYTELNEYGMPRPPAIFKDFKL